MPQGSEAKENQAPLCVAAIGRAVEPQQDLALFNRLADELKGRCRLVWIGAEKDHPLLSGHVERTGWLDRKNALKALLDADIVLHLTNYDGLSYAVLESMAMGKSLVAKDIPASRDVIGHGETGFLVQDFPDLVHVVETLLADRALRERTGRKAREMVVQTNDASLMAREYARIYAEIAQGWS